MKFKQTDGKDVNQTSLDMFNNIQYNFEDEEDCVYEIKPSERTIYLKKSHPRFCVGFFTKQHPGIKISQKFLWKIYDAIFENKPLNLWHAGENTTDEPINIGTLNIFNALDMKPKFEEFLNNFQLIINDTIDSKKIKELMKLVFLCSVKRNMKSEHFTSVIDFLMELVIKEVEYVFNYSGLADSEKIVDFKSADEFGDSKPARVATTISNEIKKYYHNKKEVYSIIYGICDNKIIQPIYWLQSDMIPKIEEKIKSNLKTDSIPVDVSLKDIQMDKGKILAVLLIP